MGYLYQRGNVWWAQFYVNGRRQQTIRPGRKYP